MAGAIYLAGQIGFEDQLTLMLGAGTADSTFFTMPLLLATLGADMVALAVFVLSSLVAMKWYAKRQF